MSERAFLGEVENEHMKLYQHSSMVISVQVAYKISTSYFLHAFSFQTNVPEPFKPKVEEQLKEGLPIGLSDAQVTMMIIGDDLNHSNEATIIILR